MFPKEHDLHASFFNLIFFYFKSLELLTHIWQVVLKFHRLPQLIKLIWWSIIYTRTPIFNNCKINTVYQYGNAGRKYMYCILGNDWYLSRENKSVTVYLTILWLEDNGHHHGNSKALLYRISRSHEKNFGITIIRWKFVENSL